MQMSVTPPYSDLEQRVLSRITEERWLELASELIRTGQPRSGNPLDPDLPPAEEEAISMLVAGKLEALGMEVTKHSAQPHRPNVLGVLKGRDGAPSLILNDHLDTYPAVEPHKWHMTDFDPFKATRHGDRLYARGTSDTRGNLAASLLAVQALIEEGVRFEGTLMCCYTVDEERNGTEGSIYMLNKVGLTADYEITAEPTAWGDVSGDWGMNLSVANSGHCLVEVTVEGIKSHIWRPDISVNAIMEAAKLLPKLKEMAFTHVPSEFMGHTPPCCSVVRIRGGLPGEMQFSPDACTITLAVVGIVPGMTLDSVISDIERLGQATFAGVNDVKVVVRQVPGSLFVNATEPVPVEEEPCRSLRAVYRRLLGREPGVNRKNAFNDTIRFREAGINAVTFGPGEDGWAVDNENISITKSVMATRIYALTIMQILGVRT
ncbi:M20 family metallopeptidase [Bradyrhizobium sp. WYCCWR 13022]|uniref:M20 family metallopeptidase n=1 Tax=unclassified Bradyrhizobium TaxID=2631580 RepID=UPI00263B57DF|nr:M20 family metallopeptidase [Bradyrhizobium sp. WYCCWR 13022]MDN4985105.1 M20 family metallopeptidase [Bradyrhizobium sp. WYCCWR 13022]